MTKHRLIQRGVGSLVATAAVVAGLSFGPAATASPGDRAPQSATGTTKQQGKLVAQYLENQWVAYSFSGTAAAALTATSYPTLEAALQHATTFTMPDVGSTGTVSVDDKCLVMPGRGIPIMAQKCSALATESTPAQSEWTLDLDGHLSTSVGGIDLNERGTALSVATPGKGASFSGPAVGRPFSAKLESANRIARSATMSGIAVPGATVVVDGSARVQADATGTWSHTITGLDATKTTRVPLDEYVSGVKKLSSGIDVQFPLDMLSASQQPSTNPDGSVTVTGQAEAGATVVAKNASGKTLATATATNRSFVLHLPKAPENTSEYPVTLTESINGQELDSLNLTITLKPTATVLTPTYFNADGTGARLLSGAGTAGASIAVKERGSGTVIGKTTVEQDGTWTLATSPLGANEHHLIASEVGKDGSAVSTVEFLVKARGFEVTSPKSYAEARSKLAEFTGTGAPGATVRIHTTNFDSPDVTTEIRNDGTWSVNKWLDDRIYVLDITHEAKDAAGKMRVQGSAKRLTLNREKLTLETPSANSEARNKLVRFSGKGHPGSKIVLRTTNFESLDYVSKVDRSGNWAISRWLGNGTYVFDIAEQAKRTGHIAITMNPEKTVDQQFAVTSPTGGTEARQKFVFLTGTGTAGALITVRTTNFSSVDVTTRVRSDGTWRVGKWFGDGAYVMDITQAGRVAGSVQGLTVNPDNGK